MVALVLVEVKNNGWELGNLSSDPILAINQVCGFEHLKSLYISLSVSQEQQTFLSFKRKQP